MRHTSSHTKNRRSHHALSATKIVKDKESGALRLPHRLDETTGMYRGKLIVPERKKALKKEEKRRAKHEAEKHEHDPAGAKEPVKVEAKVAKTKKSDATIKKPRSKTRSSTGS